jgi:hypothetical protein
MTRTYCIEMDVWNEKMRTTAYIPLNYPITGSMQRTEKIK